MVVWFMSLIISSAALLTKVDDDGLVAANLCTELRARGLSVFGCRHRRDQRLPRLTTSLNCWSPLIVCPTMAIGVLSAFP